MRDRSLKVIAGLAELDRTSLRERAMDRLRQAVTTREIAPGTRLVETELSAALGIPGAPCVRRCASWNTRA